MPHIRWLYFQPDNFIVQKQYSANLDLRTGWRVLAIIQSTIRSNHKNGFGTKRRHHLYDHILTFPLELWRFEHTKLQCAQAFLDSEMRFTIANTGFSMAARIALPALIINRLAGSALSVLVLKHSNYGGTVRSWINVNSNTYVNLTFFLTTLREQMEMSVISCQMRLFFTIMLYLQLVYDKMEIWLKILALKRKWNSICSRTYCSVSELRSYATHDIASFSSEGNLLWTPLRKIRILWS